MKRAFVATGAPEALGSAGRVDAKMNEFVAKWTAMKSDACRATHVRKQQSEDVYRLRADCLDREKTEAASIASVLMGADSQVVAKAVDIAYGLPDVSWCADVPTLRASAGLPDDPAKRARVLAVRARLADVASMVLAGKYDEAASLSRALLSMAREVGHAPTTAEVLYEEGIIRSVHGDIAEAASSLREATWMALGAGTDSTAALAAARAAWVAAAKRRRPDEAHMWLDAARAALARLGANGSEQLALEVREVEGGVLAEGDWRPDEALTIDEEIVTRYRRLLGAHPKTAQALYSLAVDFTYMGDLAAAKPIYEEALAMNLEIGGRSYFETARVEYALGDALVGLGDVAGGEAMLVEALAQIRGTSAAYSNAITTHSLAPSRLSQGDAAGALDYSERARSGMSLVPDAKVLIPLVDVPAADARMLAGHYVEALPLCERALAEQESSSEPEPEKAYGWDALRCEGEALVGLGRPADAIPLLERSLALKRRMYPGDYARAEFVPRTGVEGGCTGSRPGSSRWRRMPMTRLRATGSSRSEAKRIEAFLKAGR